MKDDLISVFLDKLNEPDPPHALLLLGVYSAASWVKSLSLKDRCVIFEFMGNELSKKGDLPMKEILIKVLQQIAGQDSLILIEKVINDGDEIHGNFIVSDAMCARDKITK